MVISNIQNELEKNGSPYATIGTDEGRTFFLIDIPCHLEFLKEEEVVSTLSQPVSTLYQPLSQPLVEAVEYWRKSDSYGLILELLTILLESTSMKGLLEKSNQKSRVRLAQYYVRPLLELELIKMKYPDNPHHQKQQYVLTEIGRMLLERLKSLKQNRGMVVRDFRTTTQIEEMKDLPKDYPKIPQCCTNLTLMWYNK